MALVIHWIDCLMRRCPMKNIIYNLYSKISERTCANKTHRLAGLKEVELVDIEERFVMFI